MSEGHTAEEAETLPPSDAEAYALAVYEGAIRKLGENRARLLYLEIKSGDLLCPNTPSSP